MPIFCTKCGENLVVSSQRTGYDPYTGSPVYCIVVKCNNYGFFATGHTDEVVARDVAEEDLQDYDYTYYYED